MTRHYPHLYIGGCQRAPETGAMFEDHDPYHQRPWALVADGTAADARRAVEAAAAAQPGWAAAGPAFRAQKLAAVAEAIDAMAEEIRAVLIAETGAVRAKTEIDLMGAKGFLQAAAAGAWQLRGEILPSIMGNRNLIERRPVGVVSVISPWNSPLVLGLRAVAWAVAVGNCVVLKPSEESPVAGGILLAELFARAGMPPGVLNVVTCSRAHAPEVGEAMIDHRAVGAVSFTGSEAVGRHIAARAGACLKRVDLELGGSDAFIVLADADLERAVDAAVFSAYLHGGQICMSGKRLIVEAPIAAAFTQLLVARVKALPYGDPALPQTAIGPMINAKQRDGLQALLQDALDKGARLLAGGGVDGLMFQPTLLAGVTAAMRLYHEEAFGPLRAIYTVADADAAIDLANAVDFGLSGAIFTADEGRGLALAARLQSGMVHVNDATVTVEPHVPFGGVKASGLGRHGGQGAIEAYTETIWHSVTRQRRALPPPFRAMAEAAAGSDASQ